MRCLKYQKTVQHHAVPTVNFIPSILFPKTTCPQYRLSKRKKKSQNMNDSERGLAAFPYGAQKGNGEILSGVPKVTNTLGD